MKILMVAYRFPPAIGGLETHVGLLSRELAKRGHDVTVYTTSSLTYRDIGRARKNRALERRQTIGGVRVERFDISFRYWSLNIIPGMFARIRASAAGFDIIHAHVYHHLSSVLACHYAKRNSRPFVLTGHNVILSPALPRRAHALKRAYDRTLGRYLVCNCDALIAVAEDQVEQYVDRGASRAAIRVIPNPVALDIFGDGSKRGCLPECDIQPDDKVLLFVGRVEPAKGVMDVIDVMPTILQHAPGAKFVIVGPWEIDMAPARGVAEALGVGDRVVIVGPKVGPGLAELYRRADIFVFPSTMDCFGIALLEAMASRTLCIAYATPGVTNVIEDGETGILVHDKNDLLGAILEHLGDGSSGERRRIERQAASRVWRYSAANVAQETEALYCRLLEPSRGV